jgi:hypothetical protein
MDVCLSVSTLCCPLRRAYHSFKGVLASVKIDYETSRVGRPMSLKDCRTTDNNDDDDVFIEEGAAEVSKLK